MSYTQTQLEEQYAKLPANLQESIMSANTAEIIHKTSDKYKLHIDQMGALADETGLVLLGLTRPYEFMTNISKRLAIPPEQASLIASEIDKEIFSRVYGDIKSLHEIKIPPKEVPVPGSEDKYREQVDLNRNQILEEIENPTRSVEPISKQVDTPVAPVEDTLVKPAEATTPAPEAKSIFNEKMVQLFNVPKATVAVDNTSKTPTPPIHAGGVDPYRETVN